MPLITLVVSEEQLKKDVVCILELADLTMLTRKMLQKKLEEKYGVCGGRTKSFVGFVGRPPSGTQENHFGLYAFHRREDLVPERR